MTSQADAGTQLQVDAYVALLDLLNDPDSFVVAKAVEGLADADMVVAVEPLVKAAEKHPDLAASVLETLARGKTTRAKAIPHLRKFCKHEKPAVRAAALTALCAAAPGDAADELLAALGAPQSEVRVAAASALLRLLESLREEAAQAREQRIRRASSGVFVEQPSPRSGGDLSLQGCGAFRRRPAAAEAGAANRSAPGQERRSRRQGEEARRGKTGGRKTLA